MTLDELDIITFIIIAMFVGLFLGIKVASSDRWPGGVVTGLLLALPFCLAFWYGVVWALLRIFGIW